jgi:hypothetical protein
MVILWNSSILNLYLCIQLLWFHFMQTSRWWSFEKNASSVFLCYCAFHSTVSSLFYKIILVSPSLCFPVSFLLSRNAYELEFKPGSVLYTICLLYCSKFLFVLFQGTIESLALVLTNLQWTKLCCFKCFHSC